MNAQEKFKRAPMWQPWTRLYENAQGDRAEIRDVNRYTYCLVIDRADGTTEHEIYHSLEKLERRLFWGHSYENLNLY